MSHSVTIAAGKNNVVLPDGNTYDAGKTVVLTDAQFMQISSSDFPSLLIDNGVVANPGDVVVIQGAHVALPAALTSPADLGAAYTQANVNALRTDVAALSTALTAALTALEGSGKALS